MRILDAKLISDSLQNAFMTWGCPPVRFYPIPKEDKFIAIAKEHYGLNLVFIRNEFKYVEVIDEQKYIMFALEFS